MSLVNAKQSQNVARQFSILLLLIALDLLTKILARHFGFFETNSGISFGLLPNSFNIWIWIVVCGVFVYQAFKTGQSAFLLIAAGGLGNLIDRLFFGAVTDWIRIILWFNIADVLVVGGALWFAIKSI